MLDKSKIEEMLNSLTFVTVNKDLSTTPVEFKWDSIPVLNDRRIRICGYGKDIPFIYVDWTFSNQFIRCVMLNDINSVSSERYTMEYVANEELGNILRYCVEWAINITERPHVVIYREEQMMDELF